jgi:hypothetical protein
VPPSLRNESERAEHSDWKEITEMSRSGWFEESALSPQVLAFDDDDDEDDDLDEYEDDDDWDDDDWDDDDDFDDEDDEDDDEDWEEWEEDEDDDAYGRKGPHRPDWN